MRSTPGESPASEPLGNEASSEAGPEELLVLTLGDALYALPVARVREIVRMRPLTPLPKAPPAVCGVISLRGDIVQVLDLRACLGLDRGPAGSPRRERIIILREPGGRLAALRVDRVLEVWRTEREGFRPPGGPGEGVLALCPRGDRFVSLLDVDALLEGCHAG